MIEYILIKIFLGMIVGMIVWPRGLMVKAPVFGSPGGSAPPDPPFTGDWLASLYYAPKAPTNFM